MVSFSKTTTRVSAIVYNKQADSNIALDVLKTFNVIAQLNALRPAIAVKHIMEEHLNDIVSFLSNRKTFFST